MFCSSLPLSNHDIMCEDAHKRVLHKRFLKLSTVKLLSYYILKPIVTCGFVWDEMTHHVPVLYSDQQLTFDAWGLLSSAPHETIVVAIYDNSLICYL